ncbi:hypothetical protein LY78DRAFT_655251 [Colletotrichum sublineola]|nr:hypothetical protein LY78DRAFT_655251 [Colletotrichum sublineola]
MAIKHLGQLPMPVLVVTVVDIDVTYLPTYLYESSKGHGLTLWARLPSRWPFYKRALRVQSVVADTLLRRRLRARGAMLTVSDNSSPTRCCWSMADCQWTCPISPGAPKWDKKARGLETFSLGLPHFSLVPIPTPARLALSVSYMSTQSIIPPIPAPGRVSFPPLPRAHDGEAQQTDRLGGLRSSTEPLTLFYSSLARLCGQGDLGQMAASQQH